MADEDPGLLRIAAVTVNCRDSQRLAEFWSALLGGEVAGVDDDGVVPVTSPGGPALDFAPVPEPDDEKEPAASGPR